MAQKSAASQQAYEAIKTDIIHHRLPGGSPLVEEDLAEQYHLSRTPIREALKWLETDRLVTYYPYRGRFVNRFGRQDILEIYAVREALECACCRSVMEDGLLTEAHLDALAENMRLAREALAGGDKERAARHGDYLHELLISLTGNGRIRDILRQMDAQCLYFSNISIQLPGRLEKSMDEHEAVLAALKNRDAERAEALLRAHIRTTRQDVLAALQTSRMETANI